MTNENVITTFQLSGGRELVDEVRARELLALFQTLEQEQIAKVSTVETVETTFEAEIEASRFRQSISSIKLSNKSFSPQAAAVLAEYMQELKQLKYIDISDVIAGRHEDLALETLTIFSTALAPLRDQLIEVNLSDNALGKKGIFACKEILIGTSLERVYFCNNGLSAEACEYLSEILSTNGLPPPLRVFQFYNNMSGDGGGVALAGLIEKCNQLEELRFSATRSMSVGCCAIANAIGKLDKLIKIDLSDTNFGIKAANILSESLEKLKSLQHLNLRDAGLTEDGVVNVLQSIKSHELKVLDISGNEISTDAMNEIGSFLLTQSKTLEELYLDDNEFGTAGLLEILSSIKSLKKLRVVSICTCELTTAGACSLAKVLARFADFKSLKIDGNMIVSKGLDELKRILNDKLEDMDDNDEDGDDDFDEIVSVEDEEDESFIEDLSKLKI